MLHHTSQSANKQLNNLIEFRQASYRCLGRAKDALFELSDAVMLTPQAPSLAHLSLSPVFRRKWPSVYEALEDGTPDREALLRLYSTHVQKSACSTLHAARVLLAGDHTPWPRPLARTLSERTYLYQSAQIPGLGGGGRPVTAGHGYSTLAWIPQEVEVLGMYDSGYGCAPFVRATSHIPCDKVLRLRPNLRLFEPPPPYRGRGPYPKHGTPFKLHDPSTWGNTDELLWTDDPVQGWVLVQVWHSLHFRASPGEQMTVITVIRISRPGARGTRRDPKAQWLAWVGYEGRKSPPVEEWWRVYGRRFALEHWYRFAKQRLHWTTPQLATPGQCERWSDLMPLVMWELGLAKGVAADRPLPWQKPQSVGNLTPGRVAQGMGGVIATIGTPTCVPKPRGKSPGWPLGKARTCRERQPVLKKGKKEAKKGRASPKKAA